MKIALPIDEGRVSPIFDVATSLLVAEVNDGAVHAQTIHSLPPNQAMTRARLLTEGRINVLICGAISRTLQHLLWLRDVEIIPHKSGFVHAVLQAYIADCLDQPRYAMHGSYRDTVRVANQGTAPGDDHVADPERIAGDRISICFESQSQASRRKTHCHWIARLDQKQVGWLSLEHDRSVGHVTYFEIENGYNAGPIAQRLFHAAVSYCHCAGLLKITSKRHLRRPRVTTLLNAMGFVASQRRGKDSGQADFYLNLDRQVGSDHLLTPLLAMTAH
jgi:predicted Fe-Mo cluster-binding NifX family protein